VLPRLSLLINQLRNRTVGSLDETAALRVLEETPGLVVKTYDEELNAYQDIVNGRIFGVARLPDRQILRDP
jgi:hypothetical protein